MSSVFWRLMSMKSPIFSRCIPCCDHILEDNVTLWNGLQREPCAAGAGLLHWVPEASLVSWESYSLSLLLLNPTPLHLYSYINPLLPSTSKLPTTWKLFHGQKRNIRVLRIQASNILMSSTVGGKKKPLTESPNPTKAGSIVCPKTSSTLQAY